MKFLHRLMHALVGTLLLAGASIPAAVNAQASSITLIVNGCDNTSYPDIVCTVTPVNNAGVPLQKLDQSSFEVLDGNTPVQNLQVQQNVSPGVKTSVMLVVDFGMVHRGQALQPLKDSAKAILEAAGNDDRVGLIAVTGPVNVDSGLDPTKEAGFASVGQKRNDMINLITSLNAVGSTPLYDSVCKALLLTAQESVGNRAVIVLSDGADVKSKVCNDTDPITRATHDRTPVFTIGVGPDLKEAYLRKLALQTAGDYQSAAQLQNVLDIFRHIESALKTQYKLTFHVTDDGSGQPKTLDIRVTQGPNKADEHTQIASLAPSKPTFDKVTFSIDGVEVNPMMLPANKTLVVEPKINARVPVTMVEYVVGGNSRKVAEPPFQLVIPTNDLINLTQITLKAAGDVGKPESFTVSDVPVGIDPATLITPTAVATPSGMTALLATMLTFPGILIPVAVLGVLLLLALLIVMMARRRSLRNAALAGDSPRTIVAGATSFVAAGPSTAVINESPTAIIGGTQITEGATVVMGGASGETMVFKPPIAVLEFSSGNLAGQQFSVGSTKMEKLSIGREPETGPGAVKINSQFVSRKHATITVEGDKIYLTDLGSASGTKLNGERLSAQQRREIKIGDKIEFADVGAELKPA